MARVKQGDLFGHVRPEPESDDCAAGAWEPFEFTGDDPRLIPQPDAVMPAEIRLPTDDDEWMPGAPI